MMANRSAVDPTVGVVRQLMCYCTEHCPSSATNNTCYLPNGGWCFAQIQAYEDGGYHSEPIISRGCLPPVEDGGLMLCMSKKHYIPRHLECCKDRSFCNLNLHPTLPPSATTSIPDNPYDVYNYPTMLHQIVLLLSVTFCAAAFVLILTFLYLRYKKRVLRRRFDLEVAPVENSFGSGETLQELLDKSQTSGSGAGPPLLVQRTIAKQVQLIRCVGKGSFGEVWKAKWRGEYLAVKIYNKAEEESWFRETEIYQTVLMRHDNILAFVAADIRGGSYTQLFLITQYHEYGALFNYLRTSILDTSSMVVLAYSAANGLTHLHTEICGMKGKPAIAHRDISSRNILVKSNGQCAIGDMALAVRYLNDTNEVDAPTNSRLGHKRYLAPEILDETMETRSFEAYKMTDIYAFGLVLWEIARRCVTRGIVEDCELPYYDCIAGDPSFDEMRKVIAVDKRRPNIPNRWAGDEALTTMTKVLTECWHQNPAARLTSLRVKKSLSKLYSLSRDMKA